MGGPVPIVIWNGILAFLTCVALVAVLEGYMFARLNLIERAILLASGIVTLQPTMWIEAVGAVAIVVVLTINFFHGRNRDRLEREQEAIPA